MDVDLWVMGVVGGFVSAAALLFCAGIIVRGLGWSILHNPLALLIAGFLATRGAAVVYGSVRVLHLEPGLRRFSTIESVTIGWVPAALAIAWGVLWLVAETTGQEMGSFFFVDARESARRLTRLQDGVLQKVVVATQMCRMTKQPCPAQLKVQAVLDDGVRDLQGKIADLVTETGVDISKVHQEASVGERQLSLLPKRGFAA